MNARKKKTEREPLHTRLWVRRGLALLALAAVVSAGHWSWTQLQRPELMPLKRVVVDGRLEHLRRDQLEAVVTLAVWGNYFTVDIDNVRRAARSLPWVASASVRRVWPDTLMINVKEREPFARWGEKALINREGEVFRPSSLDGVEDLPRLDGPDDMGLDVVEHFIGLKSAFGKAGYALWSLSLDERGGWRARITGDIEVVLGGDRMESRLGRVLKVLAALGTDAERIERIDGRYTSGLAIRWKEGTPEQVAAAVPVES